MKVYGQLERAQLENLSSDPSDAIDKPDGRVWLDTANNKLKFYDGTAIRTVVDTDSTQTITGKTIDGDNNTVQDLPVTAIKTVLADANKAIVRDGSGAPTSALIVNANIDSSAAIARSKVAAGTASHVVINDGSGNLSSEATLAISRGGTGQSTANAAFNALAPSQGSNNGKFLTTNGTDTSWGTPSVVPTIQSKSSNYTALSSDDMIICTAALTITLYAASAGTKPLTIKNATTGSNITLTPDGSDTIDNKSSQTLPPMSAVTLWPDGTSAFWAT